MTIAMKQLDRSDEAIEAIKSFRHLCPLEAQESLDNIMFELYKKTGSLQEQTQLLESRLKHFERCYNREFERNKKGQMSGKENSDHNGTRVYEIIGQSGMGLPAARQV